MNNEKEGREQLKQGTAGSTIQDVASSTIFDDVFRTMAQKMPYLMIPLINEVFGTRYTEAEGIEQLRNEFYESYGKVITDSVFRIGGNIYHIECQSKRDGRMALRMLEYDMAIALEHMTEMEEGQQIDVSMPRSCVMYIRNHRRLPKYHEVRLRFNDGQEISYRVPIIEARSYGGEELFEKELISLFPYFIMRYESTLKAKANPKEDKIVKDYEDLIKKLELLSEEKGRPELLADMLGLMKKITDYMIPEESGLRERMDEIMGGNILKLRSEELREEGYTEGLIEGQREGRIEGIAE